MDVNINVEGNGKIGEVHNVENGNIEKNVFTSENGNVEKKDNSSENRDFRKKDNTPEIENIDKSIKRQSPWLSGSFYLVLFIVVISSLAIIGKILPPYYLPIVITGAILLLAVISAFQMSNDGKLEDKDLKDIIGLSVKGIPNLFKSKNE